MLLTRSTLVLALTEWLAWSALTLALPKVLIRSRLTLALSSLRRRVVDNHAFGE